MGVFLASGQLVERYLKIIRNLTTHVKDVVYDQNDLISIGNYVLNGTQKLASTLVNKTDAHNISLQTLGTELAYISIKLYITI